MNNLTKYLISFALLCLSNVAISEEIKFSINCEVIDQVVLEVKDGKSNRYTSLHGLNVGDKTSIKFRFYHSADSYMFWFDNNQLPTAYVQGAVDDKDYEVILEDGRIVSKSSGIGGKTVLGEDHMSIDGCCGASIIGKRYFKNDWSLIVKGGNYTVGNIQVLNCMSVPDDYNSMVKKIRDFHTVNPESINR